MSTLHERMLIEGKSHREIFLSDTLKVQNTNIDGIEKLKKYIKESFKEGDYKIGKRRIYLFIHDAPIKTTSGGVRYFVYRNIIFTRVSDIAKMFGVSFGNIRKCTAQIDIKASNTHHAAAFFIPLDFVIDLCPEWVYSLKSLLDDILNDINSQIRTNAEKMWNMNTKKSLAVIEHLPNVVEIGGIIFVKHESQMYIGCKSLCALSFVQCWHYIRFKEFSYAKLPYQIFWNTAQKKLHVIKAAKNSKHNIVCIPLGEIWRYVDCINNLLSKQKYIDKVYIDSAVNLAKEFLFREDKNMNEENINQEQGAMSTGVFMDKVKNYSKYTIEGMEKLCYSYNTLCKDYNNLSNDYKETTSKLQNCEEEILLLREKARKYDTLIELIKQE